MNKSINFYQCVTKTNRTISVMLPVADNSFFNIGEHGDVHQAIVTRQTNAPRLRRFKRNISTQVCPNTQTSSHLSQRGASVVANKKLVPPDAKIF